MRKDITNKTLKNNIILSISVQVVSLIVSFILNLIVPRYIPELEYSYWQIYVLYAGYVGVLHFGLLDGIVLRYSQYDYDELDKPRLRSQFQIMLVFNVVFALMLFLIAFLCSSSAYKYVIYFVSVAIITKNIFTYTSYSFQITNRISKYAILVISQRLVYGLVTVMLLIFHVQNFYLYCIADLLGDVFGFLVGFKFNKDLFFGKAILLRDAFHELKTNISSGIILLIANWSSMLVVGSAKMIIQWHWSELTFGKVSFSISVSNLFLAFVTAISVVLFPSLKRMDKEKLPILYMKIRNLISPLLFIALIMYYPGCLILHYWLPKYNDSLKYLGLLMPIIVYTSKVGLLTNNYLKAYREEKKMLMINVGSVIISILCFLLAAFIFDSLTLILLLLVIVIMMRSIVSELVVMKIIGIKMVKDFIVEGIMTIAFISFAKLFDLKYGFALYGLCLAIYFVICQNNLRLVFTKKHQI